MAATQAPPPQCADPDGLYGEYVTAVYVAGRNARSAKGISGLLKAAAPLKGLKTMESRLAAEAARAMAKNRSSPDAGLSRKVNGPVTPPAGGAPDVPDGQLASRKSGLAEPPP